MKSFADRLADAVRRTRNPLCVGIDPRWESLPLAIRRKHSQGSHEDVANAYLEFGTRVLELVEDKVPAIKPQSAFFEACGYEGMRVQGELLQRAKAMGFITVLDSKRGDIASTATAYAEASFRVWDADSLTVNPYLGQDSVEPFLASAKADRRGIFVLVRTSNPGGGMFQNLMCDGKPLYRQVAERVATWNEATLGSSGLGDVGAVVGATNPRELDELRKAMPNVWFLVPGYGAQGGTANDVKAAFRNDGLGAIVNSSRGITFPFHPDDPDWERAIVAATDKAVHELAIVGGLR
jgi:orotidine-5'-phosphate decarboxylase